MEASDWNGVVNEIRTLERSLPTGHEVGLRLGTLMRHPVPLVRVQGLRQEGFFEFELYTGEHSTLVYTGTPQPVSLEAMPRIPRSEGEQQVVFGPEEA